MNKINLMICVFAAVLLVASFAAAMEIPANENADTPTPVTQLTKDGKLIERIDFIHYANGVTKPARSSKDPVCYKLMKAKWTSMPINYSINPANSELGEGFLTSAISASAETWDDATDSTELFGSYAVNYSAQFLSSTDGKNSIAFGDYSTDGVIAVTRTWYYRGIGKSLGTIVEFDMLFDTDFNWGNADENSGVMDLQNIATHELGHGIGLLDLYIASCSSVTMYGYSSEGDIGKRTLAPADITGLQKIYGI